MSPKRHRPTLPPEASYALSNGLRLAANLARERHEAPDYVSLTLSGAYPDLAPARNLLQQQVLPRVTSLREIVQRIERVADDPRVSGLILHLRELQLSMAQLQSLREALEGLRRRGKRVVAWSHTYGTGSYYLASAADEILIQPGGGFRPMGLRRDFAFLAEPLERLGMRFDLLQISPYKSAGDSLTRRALSDEARAMNDWLLDEAYDDLLNAIGSGRGLDRGGAAALVDATPCTDLAALEQRSVDAICSEEDLADRLAIGGRPARIADWSKAARQLRLARPSGAGRRVALIRIEGAIVDGTSEHPPFPAPLPLPMGGGPRAGDLTVVQQARAALDDDRVAAAVVYIDSPGGSATASEAMAAALERLAARKPVVAVMGSVAASGGYYVATPASWIIARSGTITGSIGVLSGKLVSAGLLDRLHIGRDRLTRGANIDFESGETPFSPAERARAWQAIERTYAVFVDRVSRARGLTPAEVDAIGGGRVWTGRQAMEQGLVDAIGGLEAGLIKARQLAGLGAHAPIVSIGVPKPALAPLGAPVAAGLQQLRESLAWFDGRSQCRCPLLGPERLFWDLPSTAESPWSLQ
ncbi:MAG: S49 family peptidase [Caldilineae bacterium]|nr:S49 family peptidase [Chloroflexota bacterium]MCB9175740.1 S49 family peptidase [Caldilineae bacterium]